MSGLETALTTHIVKSGDDRLTRGTQKTKIRTKATALYRLQVLFPMS